MPRIPTYASQVDVTSAIPTAQVPTKTVGAAGLMTFGEQLGKASDRLYDLEQRKQASEASVAASDLSAKYTVEVEKQATAAAPGDTSWADKLKQDFQKDADEARAKFDNPAARALFDRSAGTVAKSITQSVGLWEVRSTAKKAEQDYKAAVGNYSTALFHDPSQFQDVLSNMNNAFDDPNGPYAKVPGAARDGLRQMAVSELAKASVRGWIDKDPEDALKQIEQGRWSGFLKDDESIRMLRSEAQQGIRNKRADENLARIEEERARKAEQEKVFDSLLQQVPKYGGGGLTMKQIWQSNLPPEKKEHLAIIVNADAKPPREENLYGAGYLDIFKAIHAPDGAANKITSEDQLYKHVENGDLSLAGLNMLRQEIKGRRTVEGTVESDLKKRMMDYAESKLVHKDTLTGFKDPEGEKSMLRFMASFDAEYRRQREAGKSVAELLDPESKDWLGKLVTPLVRSREQIMKDIFNNPVNAGAGGAGDGFNIPEPKTREEKDKLAPGTRYKAPDGQIRVR